MIPRPLYIFDLDGTLANLDHRKHHLEATDKEKWNRFYDACGGDIPILPVLSTLNRLILAGAEVWIFSGRSARVRQLTTDWLLPFVYLSNEELALALVMRPEGDNRPDDELKQMFLDSMLEFDRQRLVAVFDDRQRVVDMWRRNGIPCFQVAPGDF